VRALLQALPHLARTVAGLASDPVLPWPAKVALGAAIVYLVSPLDLLPHFLPLVEYLDDLLVAAIVLDGVLTYVDRSSVLRYWPGRPESLEQVARVAHTLAAWVPRRVKARIFSPRRS
jgi:uncharacterized membrane protein YkvA (DUF1232 family)